MKIFIGTANFGKKYGAIHNDNVLSEQTIIGILQRVIELPNLFIDTAESYTNSEYLIGKHAPKKLNKKITTKLTINRKCTFNHVLNLAKRSLFEAKQDSFYSLLVHNSDALNYENADEIVAAFEECKRLELTERIGVSCYEASDLITISSRYDSFSEFQMPENLMDQRNFSNPRLQIMKESGKSIQVRSIFLQGAILTGYHKLPDFFKPEINAFKSFEESCNENNISKLKACLDYARCIKWKNGIVVGIQSEEHLDQILSELSMPVRMEEFNNKVLSIPLVDPRTWKAIELSEI